MQQFLELGSPKHLLAALRILPLIITVVLLAPAWFFWIFLPEGRQKRVIDLVKQLIEWTRATRDESPSS
ncbi:hypothetical protein [Streptomyces sp. FL07-04A]|uniref:hypothetical protein n=1 Tax=Streptomyces sp. FL07-04A TaxID=3028658 RepID=UPI0029B574B2|nr:hypothetical protein [Streptomyces sp. FL07-04A]MDX3577223.1 hypothetical protein [Streptomyces sp. FL07-04A]